MRSLVLLILLRQCVGDCSGDDCNAQSYDEGAVQLLQTDLAVEKSKLYLSQTDQKGAYPSDYISCPSQQIIQTEHMTLADYDEVVGSMKSLYQSLPSQCDTQSCPQADWAGCVLRLAAHDFLDYQAGLGGSDGCVSLGDPDNKGIGECLYEGLHGAASLAQAYTNFCSRISLADYLVIAAEAVMNITRQNVLVENPQREPLDFRSKFQYGRTTQLSCDSYGKLPDAERGCLAVNDTMVQSLGLTWGQSAALMGAHTIGSASKERSGYTGSWTSAQSSRLFDNSYWTSMLFKGWGKELSVGGNPLKNQWQRVDVGLNETLTGHEMMLESDLCLYFGGDLPEVKDTAHRDEWAHLCTCAWTRIGGPHDHWVEARERYNNGELCGVAQLYPASGEETSEHVEFGNNVTFAKQRAICCAFSEEGVSPPAAEQNDCANQGPARDDVMLFGNDESLWLSSYLEAWEIATTNGHASLSILKDQ